MSAASFDRGVCVLFSGSGLRTLTLPHSVRRVQARALSGVCSLRSVVLDPELRAIGDGALAETGLAKLTLSRALEEVGP